jgi:Cu(I)-responsive transcriptional regulator
LIFYKLNYKLSPYWKVKEYLMNIGKAASKAGLSVKTVRYYANIGMVAAYQDPQTGYREYSDDDVAKLQFIGKARRFNFSIEECRELLSLYQDKNRPSKEVKALTLEKIAEIEEKLAELQGLRDQLHHLATHCQGDDRPDCPILEALSASSDR